MPGASIPPGRILVLGGSSELGLAILAALPLAPGTEVLLAGRAGPRLDAAARQVTALGSRARALPFDAIATASHEALISDAFAGGPVAMVIAAAGILVPQPVLDADPELAGRLVQVSLTGHVTTLLAAACQLRRQGSGVIVVLSSAAAVRPRRANFVYGAAKAGLDAFGRGLADSLHGSGVRVLLVRPGFVAGRMTAGLPRAPLASTPAQVGAAVAGALARGSPVVWVPRRLAMLAPLLRLIPRPAWRRL
ncbi:MAG TPA: SDR family NAD(P)-dependent oxidoreductase, partial [Streptosporangiaceae bacterium]